MYTVYYDLNNLLIEFRGEKFIFEKNTEHLINNQILKLKQICTVYCLLLENIPLYYFDNHTQFKVQLDYKYEIINPNYTEIVPRQRFNASYARIIA